ncbi:hypothetical protein [Azonexus sp.]|uniref:hypothetical protein n=1 Tax=Azonexus sp. TaxID=1872668 RepID=UPI0035B0E301
MKYARAFLLCCGLFMLFGQEALAHGHRTRVGVVIGVPLWGPFWDPFPWHPYYPPYPPVVVTPPPPPVYIEQAEPLAAPAPATEDYWYYCSSARAYYPDVRSCPEDWLPVLPRSAK